ELDHPRVAAANDEIPSVGHYLLLAWIPIELTRRPNGCSQTRRMSIASCCRVHRPGGSSTPALGCFGVGIRAWLVDPCVGREPFVNDAANRAVRAGKEHRAAGEIVAIGHDAGGNAAPGRRTADHDGTHWRLPW